MTTGHPAAGTLTQLTLDTIMKALSVLDPKAAGIDVGSEKLHVSIAGDLPKVFGTFTGELENLCAWFKEQGVCSVAMEATGVYWLYLYEVLEAAGLAVWRPTWRWRASWRSCFTGCCATVSNMWRKDSKVMKPKFWKPRHACCANWPKSRALHSSQPRQVK